MTRSDKIFMSAFIALWFAASAALALPTLSFGADALPSKKVPPAPEPIFVSWSGPYVGIWGGYGFSDQNASVEAFDAGNRLVGKKFVPFASRVPGVAHLNTDGFVGGGTLGWNYEFPSHIVLGVEGDFGGLAGSKKTVTFVAPTLGLFPAVAQIGRAWDFGGTLGPRLGYAVLPNLLIYAKGGFAFAHLTQSVTSYGSVFAAMQNTGNGSHMLPGWFVGGGAEYALEAFHGLSVKVEYDHVDLGDHTASFSGIAYGSGFNETQTFLARQRATEEIVKVGLNWRFGSALANLTR